MWGGDPLCNTATLDSQVMGNLDGFEGAEELIFAFHNMILTNMAI